MRNATSFLIASLIGWTVSADARSLKVQTLSTSHVAGREVIIGRARCAGVSWLLTDTPALTRISVGERIVSSSPVRGLRHDDKLWGLACLAETELWTLAAHDALARLAPDGRVAERLQLDRPRLGIYSAGERLLLQHPPSGVGKPLLSAGLPRKPSSFSQWPAPLAQRASSRDAEISANLVSCGIGAEGFVPCWLANQSLISISDGSRSHTSLQELRFVRASAIDEAVPIWDVALAGTSRAWVLSSARGGGPDGRRVGGRLTMSTRRGADDGSADLTPGARLIVSATDERCVLLSAAGELLEVAAP
jgi:hypothetical protein